MVDTMYDVIVVGAGPSGGTAAAILARRGLKTLILDREDFPREKACGDAVQTAGFRIMREIGMKDPWPDTFFDIANISVVSPNGSTTKVALHATDGERARVVTRYDFDSLLLNYAISCGAEFRKCLVTDAVIEDGTVVGVKAKQGKITSTIRGRLVIAADGATSAIARSLGTPVRPDQHKAVSLRGYIEVRGDLDRTIELAFIKDVLPGYGWIFPMGNNCANIGVGIRADYYKKNKKSLEQYLDIYMKTLRIGGDICDPKTLHDVKSWQLPMCSMEQRRVYNGAILVGDAGGFVNPLTGAGISQGMITAKIAAEVGAQALERGTASREALASYEPLWRKQLQSSMQIGTIAQQLLTWMPSTVDAITWLGRISPMVVQKVFAKM